MTARIFRKKRNQYLRSNNDNGIVDGNLAFFERDISLILQPEESFSNSHLDEQGPEANVYEPPSCTRPSAILKLEVISD